MNINKFRKTMKKKLTFFLFIFSTTNLASQQYVINIAESLLNKNKIEITCSEGLEKINNVCYTLVNKVNRCSEGFSPYGIDKCLSETAEDRIEECPSGYTYSAQNNSCLTTIRLGDSSGACGGGSSGCIQEGAPSESSCAILTCPDNSTEPGWYYERCNDGYSGGDGYCYENHQTSYTLSSCRIDQLTEETTCRDIQDVLVNVCPVGKTEYNENYCY
tara:strand:+ start:1574 stop:2224 length:651 start_codon:yes stop_codon:yes gene_type:complete